ncbi:MAG: phosphatidylglycerophosphatase A [Desulfovibrionaceae bacterium]|jgi:phosphatidylglycerophosphatase A|nr:phosphatidylglycerophosphatase A [Desulfovibrionaceae bacterium]
MSVVLRSRPHREPSAARPDRPDPADPVALGRVGGTPPADGRGRAQWPDRLALAVARVWPAGLSPVMPGTCGSIVAALLAPFVFLPLPFFGRVALLALLFWLGGVAATRAERVLGRKDPGEVVVDEVLGQWLAYLPLAASASAAQLAAGLVLFRVFDIAKPWPVRASEDWLAAGYGVMIDDVVAGLYALAALQAVLLLLPL